MALFYKIGRRHNLTDGKVQWCIQLRQGDTVKFNSVVRAVAMRVGMSRIEVENVLSAYSDVVGDLLLDGNRVCGAMGTYSISISSPLSESQETLNAESVTNRTVRFRCGNRLLERLRREPLCPLQAEEGWETDEA